MLNAFILDHINFLVLCCKGGSWSTNIHKNKMVVGDAAIAQILMYFSLGKYDNISFCWLTRAVHIRSAFIRWYPQQLFKVQL